MLITKLVETGMPSAGESEVVYNGSILSSRGCAGFTTGQTIYGGTYPYKARFHVRRSKQPRT